MTHAYAYVRTSAAVYAYADRDLATQLRAIRRFAAQHGYQIVATFEEHGSQSDPDRPALDALAGATEYSPNPVIIVSDRSRIFHSPIDFGYFEEWLACCDAQLKIVNDTPLMSAEEM